ncbi:helix-turn-helix transcriptional regulator [Alteromonas sp. BMJM2]|uniref:helix-turn-helix transcriptional regulator n=1 Tax=Alteromonas sp. BMJM2 TaxID=2954241 RepID=UPI0022B47BB5|nr:WYL domain-containing protein [Alteromonas sp. BMJM2]
MSSSLETMTRYWHILSQIPVYPRSITVRQIVHHLELEGFSVNIRMVQRDLNYLSSVTLFPISCEVEGRRQSWFWPASQKALSLPLMSTSMAIALYMIKDNLLSALPKQVIHELEPYFHTAEELLNKKSSNTAKWKKKFKKIDAGYLFHAPVLCNDIEALIYEAVLADKQISVLYQPRNSEPKHYVLSPLGIVCKGNVLYLVARSGEGQDVKQFHLSRFQKVEILASDVVRLKNFDLDEYVEKDAAFSYPIQQKAVELMLEVDESFVFFFENTTIGEHQAITNIDEKTCLVTAHVTPNSELIWWLAGRSDLITVTSPAVVKDELMELLRKANQRYGIA